MTTVTDELKQLANRHEEFIKEWDALPEEEKDKRKKAIAGWADRINAEDEAFALQIELKNKKKAMRITLLLVKNSKA
ncbi:MAG: hypothetical protein WCP85_16250 [Mariniphaga sp.]